MSAKRRVAVGLIGLVVATTAVGASVAIATSMFNGPDSGVTGQVVCAVILERGTGCSPMQASVVVRDRSSNRRVATAKLRPMGHFSVALEPGDYLVEVHPTSGLPPGRPGVSVIVTPHRYTHVFLGMVPHSGPGLLRPKR